MGGQQFTKIGTGNSSKEAFHKLVEQAQYEHGHGGYSGTIAEKHEFKLLVPPPGVAALDMAQWVQSYVAPEHRWPEWKAKYPAAIENDVLKASNATRDKWGPAGAYEIQGEELAALKKVKDSRIPRGVYEMPEGQRAFVFFGWASS